jgi:hypothetical protein
MTNESLASVLEVRLIEGFEAQWNGKPVERERSTCEVGIRVARTGFARLTRSAFRLECSRAVAGEMATCRFE